MVNLLTIKIATTSLIILTGCITVAFIDKDQRVSNNSSTPNIAIMQPGAIHSAAWYISHPDILKQDEERCGGDATTISQSACQNVDSAENELGIEEMKKAASQNGSVSKPNN